MAIYGPVVANRLFTLAESFGQMAADVQAGTLGEIARISVTSRFLGLAQADFPIPELGGLISAYRRREAVNLGDVEDALLVTEGRILGELARFNVLPPDFRKRIEGLFFESAVVDRQAIVEAYRWIRTPFLKGLTDRLKIRPVSPEGGVPTTALASSELLSLSCDPPRPVFLKREGRSRGMTSFLVGAFLLGFRPPEWGLMAACSAPDAEGLFTVAQSFGFTNLDLILPRTESPEREQGLKERGAHVIRIGEDLARAEEIARSQITLRRNTLLMPGSDHPLVLAGWGTIGMEIDRQMRFRQFPRYAVVVPSGFGSALAGLSLYLSDRQIPVFGTPSEAGQNPAMALNAASFGLAPGLPVVVVMTDGS